MKETWRETGSAMNADLSIPDQSFMNKSQIIYKADAEWDGPWRSPVHMFQWNSRITLEITNVRVERLQDISEEDAKAEGVKLIPGVYRVFGMKSEYEPMKPFPYKDSFRGYWNSINEKRGHGWDKNPWVWVLEYKVLK